MYYCFLFLTKLAVFVADVTTVLLRAVSFRYTMWYVIKNLGDDILTLKIKSAKKKKMALTVLCPVSEDFNFVDHVVVQG